MTQSVTASISKGPDSVIYSRNSHNATKILSFKWTRDTGKQPPGCQQLLRQIWNTTDF